MRRATTNRPILLAILDGWGEGAPTATNAVHVANTPNMDTWRATYPTCTLIAHNGLVGLPRDQMGNSEVGHLNIGAGRIVYQDFSRINRAIADNTFFDNPVLIRAMEQIRHRGSALHLLGLVSDGGVHSHIDHLKALLRMARQHSLQRVYVHAFMDGRDTPPHSGIEHMRSLQATIQRIGCGRVATVIGRYYAMDRDNRWDRVQRAWEAMVAGKGVSAMDPVQAVRAAYDRGETDEFIKPMVLLRDDQPMATIRDHDSVLFFNFRADRARQLTRAFTDQAFDRFADRPRPCLAEFVTFTRYDKAFDLPVAFAPQTLHHILGEEISRHGQTQLRIAETEKYAHVTYFFNGGREEPFPLEERMLIPSPREVATYDLKPEMSALTVTDALLQRLTKKEYSLVVLNFANGDMVGHTGNMAATVRACETVDQCMKRLVDRFLTAGGMVLITADHGNAEIMYDPVTNGMMTAHSSNPVPFILVSDRHLGRCLRRDGALRDIAPTILQLHGLPVPTEMDGHNLLLD